MSQGQVQTVGSAKDKILVVLSLLFAVGGAVLFQALAKEDFFIRLGVVLAGVMLAVVSFLLSQTGKRFVAFSKDAANEAKRVVWPTRKEATQMTAIVFAFLLVMTLYLLMIDKGLEWLLYNLILGWTR